MTPFELHQLIKERRYISSSRVLFIPEADCWVLFDPGTLENPRGREIVVYNPVEVLDFIRKQSEYIPERRTYEPPTRARKRQSVSGVTLADLGL